MKNSKDFYQALGKVFAKVDWMQILESDPDAAWHKLATNCAMDAFKNDFASRRGIYIFNDVPTKTGRVICLYNNNPYQALGHGNAIDDDRRAKETELFRNRMHEVGIVELGYGTYPPPGDESEAYSYAMILDTDENQVSVIGNAMDDAVREASEWMEDSRAIHEEDDDASGTITAAINVGEKTLLREVRLGQDAFSRAVRENYGYRCCFPGCDVDHHRLLVGAHIVRWADDSDSRGHVSNGLCLCGLHDKAFEMGLFTLTDDLCVKVDCQKAPMSTWVKLHLQNADGLSIKLGRIRPSLAAVRRHRGSHA